MCEKKKVAVIFESSPFDRKGLFNAVHERIRHLAGTRECEVDAFCIHARDNVLTRMLRHTSKVPHPDSLVIDDVKYRMLWYWFSVTDHILVWKLHREPIFFRALVRRAVNMLEGYDVVSAHSFAGALIAAEASAKFGMPYYVSWHGSDVHTFPRSNSLIMRRTKVLMEGAACNFFVSRALLDSSSYICTGACKRVLYNGVSESFVRFPEPDRLLLRRKFSVEDNAKVVAFVGNLVAVKNVTVLHPLFRAIRAGYDGPLQFWVVGDGKLHDKVVPLLLADDMIDVRFWGNVPSVQMPSLMNCIDLLVLPSLNEGLPLVTVEALRCGASVVGSDAGGIPEVTGQDCTVPLGPSFVDNMAALACRMLSDDGSGCTGNGRKLPEQMDWNKTASAELDFIRGLV